MLPDMDVLNCQGLAVPMAVMQRVVNVESSFNPYAIGVVGGRLRRQPANLPEALSTARMLERRGYNFSLGLAQVNRYNLAKYGLTSYEQAFQGCPNLRAGARILADCHARSGNDWGRSLSCYYSGDFVTGFRLGYVQKVFASAPLLQRRATDAPSDLIEVNAVARQHATFVPDAKPARDRREGGEAQPTGHYAPAADVPDVQLQPANELRTVEIHAAGDQRQAAVDSVPAASVAPPRDQAFVF